MLSGNPIKLILVDDHQIVLDGLRAMFNQDPDFLILGAAGSAEEASILLEQFVPDVLLTDYRLPRATGLELAVEVKKNTQL
jgi:YesN/AraC family two-component response regulator